MTTWRDELLEAIKTRAERDAEEEAKRKKRLEEALKIADEASEKAHDGLAFTHDHLVAKGLSPTLTRDGNAATLEFCGQTLTVDLDRTEAMLKVAANGGRPREFDFAKDRHIAPKDVEEYVGRRALELVRAANKTTPW
jgi:hypothetical protein